MGRAIRSDVASQYAVLFEAIRSLSSGIDGEIVPKIRVTLEEIFELVSKDSQLSKFRLYSPAGKLLASSFPNWGYTERTLGPGGQFLYRLTPKGVRWLSENYARLGTETFK